MKIKRQINLGLRACVYWNAIDNSNLICVKWFEVKSVRK
jgi:hypothetical protein